MKIFNGHPFFSLFFVARANQKIRISALGRESSLSLHHGVALGLHSWNMKYSGPWRALAGERKVLLEANKQ
jgi:hypothetical protein